MRLPRPAAGMIPHMSGLHRHSLLRSRPRRFECRNKVDCSSFGGVFGERAFARRAADAREFAIAEIEGRNGLLPVARDNDFAAGREKMIKSFPIVAQDRN